MFTGLIRDFGEVVSYQNEKLKIKSKLKPQIGDSIAVNGACLTVVEKVNDTFLVELSHETRKHIASENLERQVHLEPAMSLKDRFDGHIVQGHIDGIGEITSIKQDENAYDMFVKVPGNLQPLMMPKGSVCVDGVSLTVNEIINDKIRLTIIPHTFKNTLFDAYKEKRRVNIESDMFARYIYNILHQKKKPTWDEIDKIMSLY